LLDAVVISPSFLSSSTLPAEKENSIFQQEKDKN
jgi:hypothetical protein